MLLPLVLEAAGNAGINKPNCDIIILHPMMNETNPLLLANAEALYAEIAAGYSDPLNQRYNGRRLIIGSGGQAYTMDSLADLEKTAATLIRLTTDPLSGITQEYWNSLPNRHVLRELETETSLPTHLSSATPITIGFGDLGQQVIQVDTARLISRFVLGPVQQDKTQEHVNRLVTLLNFLRGGDNDTQSKILLNDLTTYIRGRLGIHSLSETGLRRLNALQQADTLRQTYRIDRETIQQEGARQIPQFARQLYTQIIESLRLERAKYIVADNSLTQLLNDYVELQKRIKNLQGVLANFKVGQPFPEEYMQRQLDELARRKQQVLPGLLAGMQRNLDSMCDVTAIQTATEFLNALEGDCVDAIGRLQAFIQRARQNYEHEAGWNTERPRLQAHSDYPLYIPAFSTDQAMARYYERVSIFTRETARQNFLNATAQTQDPLTIFRNELKDRELIEHFFDGRSDIIFDAMQQHVNERVGERLKRAPLLDVLEEAGDLLLNQSIKTALERAQSLIPFTRDYATNCVEEWYVSAAYSDDRQRTTVEKAMKQVSERAKLFKSDDPTEIVVFYLIDGLSMPAINDLAGRCLSPFLEKRATWTRYNGLSNQKGRPNQRNMFTVGNPIYSGHGNEMSIYQQGIIHKLYIAKAGSVPDYTPSQVPELEEPDEDQA